jgi:hypothetical protein
MQGSLARSRVRLLRLSSLLTFATGGRIALLCYVKLHCCSLLACSSAEKPIMTSPSCLGLKNPL